MNGPEIFQFGINEVPKQINSILKKSKVKIAVALDNSFNFFEAVFNITYYKFIRFFIMFHVMRCCVGSQTKYALETRESYFD